MKKIFARLSTFWQMSIMTFLVMVAISAMSYVLQFFIMKVWVIDYEKDNIKDMYRQIELFFDYHTIEQGKYLRYFDLEEVDFWMYDEQRNILIVTDDVPYNILDMELPLNKKVYLRKISGEPRIALHAPIYVHGKRYYIYIEKEIEIYEDFIERLIPIIIFSIILITILSLFAGIYISRKFINKLKYLKITMENVKEKGVSSRVEIINRKDEFEKLGILFNSMMDEVEKSFNQQKQFVQDASHELRTPLTILKGHLQMLNRWGKHDPDTLDKSLKIASEELERLIKLVNDLLSLNNMESYRRVKVDEYINIIEVIEEVIYGFDILSNDVNFYFEKEKPVYLNILREHLKQLIIIFIDNAIKYCDKDKKYINIRVYEDDGKVYISIRDNGIGIKKEDINKVTDKFYRVDKSRKYNNSFGIGLAIAAQLVKLYKGKLKIRSEFGVFTEVIVSFVK